MEDEENLEELEQQLYAQVFHDSNIEGSIEVPANSSNSSPLGQNQQSKMRYWQNPKSAENKPKVPWKQKQKNKKLAASTKQPTAVKEVNAQAEQESIENIDKSAAIKPYFVPYSSVLSFMSNPELGTIPKDIQNKILELPKSFEKKKSKPPKFPKEKGKFLKPSKNVTKQKYEAKKVKAEEVRKKIAGKNPVIIELATSSDDDSVIHIENPAPPLISIDSSDDESRKRKKRAASPSTSSMVSDDFIITSDKRRIINPFANPELLTVTLSEKLKESNNDRMKKMKALTKVSSSSSNSNSARSSCERAADDSEKISSAPKIASKKKKRDKVNSSNETDDSKFATICAMTLNKKCIGDTNASTQKSSSSSDDEDNSICVTAKDAKVRRRKSTGSRKGKDSENEEDGRNQKINTSTPLAHKKKRSRFITPNYNEDEFASMISTVIQSEVIDEIADETINTGKALIEAIEKDDKQVEITTQTQQDSQNDCEIIEQNVPTFNVSDEDMPENSDSDDSIRNVSNDIQCDLTLNIRKSDHTPHEFTPVEQPKRVTIAVETHSKVLDCEVGWNDEMRFFYNECTMGRDFCITTIKNSMPTDPKLWRVNHTDKTRVNTDSDRRIRCRNCNEWGHKERYCSRPRKQIICYMCGTIGHRETRCPNSICLRCGKPNQVYATMCGNCSKFVKRTCPLCHHKGHDMDQCPDKWRRYHSTITVTENSSTLDITYKRNPRIYCSLCARSGHFAENCSYINKLFHGLIKSSWFVISNKPSYATNYTFNAARENEHVLQLFTYMENYSFNLRLPSNCQFYPKFREVFLRHQEQVYGRELQPSRCKQKRKRDKRIENDKTDASLEVNGSQEENNSNVQLDDSNSNYSFSEFYKPNTDQPCDTAANNENQIVSVGSDAQSLADYIPFVSANNQIIPHVDDSQKVCDSKVMLTKDHATILMSQKGQNLLFDLGERFNIISQFRFDSMGNSICLTGLPLNQQLFHMEMKDFLYKCGLDEYEKMIEKTTQIPKIICRIVSYLRSNFQSIRNSGIRETKQLLDKLTTAERQFDHKKAIKCRKALNIIFIGNAELGDGAKHMNELRKILNGLEKEIELGNGDSQVDPKLRNEISVHIRYVFSAIDHSSIYGGYRRMFEEYKRVIMRRQNSDKGNLLSNR